MNQEMIRVSVIIPMYNSEKHMSLCLNSLLKQDYKNVEIIIIDDGSTDNTLCVAKEYAQKDSRIKVITQTNRGPSAARNAGIDQSRGSIICFVDSDDYVEPDYINRLVGTFDSEKADAVFFGFRRLNTALMTLSTHNLPIKGEDYFINITQLSRADMFGYTWIKALKKEIIGETRFKEKLRLFEDEVFSCEVFQKECNVVYLNTVLYNYVRDPSSLSEKTNQNYYECCEEVYCGWKRLLDAKANAKTNENIIGFLNDKANHLAINSMYYGLERKVNYFKYYKELCKCSFVKESTINNRFIDFLRKNRLLSIMFFHWNYVLKNHLKSFLFCKAKR